MRRRASPALENSTGVSFSVGAKKGEIRGLRGVGTDINVIIVDFKWFWVCLSRFAFVCVRLPSMHLYLHLHLYLYLHPYLYLHSLTSHLHRCANISGPHAVNLCPLAISADTARLAHQKKRKKKINGGIKLQQKRYIYFWSSTPFVFIAVVVVLISVQPVSFLEH